jgi:hypothetical protein
MNRLLITLLALLTGLAAQVSPAAAAVRAGGQTEIGTPAAPVGQLRRSVTVISDQARRTRAGPVRTEGASLQVGASHVLSRPVLTGIDRARE